MRMGALLAGLALWATSGLTAVAWAQSASPQPAAARAKPCAPVAAAARHGPDVISDPDWCAMPNGDDLVVLYPKAARDKHVEGRVVMQCNVAADGRLEGCIVVTEEPAGYGLGQATLQAASFFAMRPKTVNGVPVAGGVVRIPLNWRIYQAGAGVNPPVLDPPRTIGDGSRQVMVSWTAMPTRADLAALYPAATANKRVGGDVAMRCQAGPDESLSGCTILSEDPPGYGLGDATLALAGKYKLSPTTSEGGSPAGLSIRTTVTWSAGLPETAQAPPPPPRPAAPTSDPHTITNPDWLRMPNGDELADLFPQEARDKNVEGRTRMLCGVMADGRLESCAVLSEAPLGYGFGRASLEAGRYFKMRARTIDGAPVAGGRVVVPIAWAAPPDDGYGVTPPTLDPPQPSQDGQRQVMVSWATMPAYADLDALFPKAAADWRVGGEAILRCRVEPGGGLSGCTIAAEYPSGYGLGEATLALAGKFRLSSTTSEGGPTAGLVVTTTVIWSEAQRRLAHLNDHDTPKH